MKKHNYLIVLLILGALSFQIINAQFIPDRFTNRRMNLMNDATSVGWNPALLGMNGKTDAVLVIPYDRTWQSTNQIGGFVSHQGIGLGFTSGRNEDLPKFTSVPFSIYGGLGLQIPHQKVWVGSAFRYSEFGGRTIRYSGSVIYTPIDKLYMSLGLTNMYSSNTRDHVYEMSAAYSPLHWLTLHGRIQYCPDSTVFTRNNNYASEIGLSAAVHNRQIIASFIASPEAKQARFGLEVAFDVLSIGVLNEGSTLNNSSGRFTGGNILLRVNHDQLFSIRHDRLPDPTCSTTECPKSGCWGELCNDAICPSYRCIKMNCPGMKCNVNKCEGLHCTSSSNTNTSMDWNVHPPMHGKKLPFGHPEIPHSQYDIEGHSKAENPNGCPLCGCAMPNHSDIEAHHPMKKEIRIRKRIIINDPGFQEESGNHNQKEIQIEIHNDPEGKEKTGQKEIEEIKIQKEKPIVPPTVKPAPEEEDTDDDFMDEIEVNEDDSNDETPFEQAEEPEDELSSNSQHANRNSVSGNSGKTYKLRRVFFETAQWKLKPESTKELIKLYAYLSENPQMCIQLNAHTDNVGNDVYNRDLSQKRAQAVVDFLIEKGIDSGRIVAKGYGEEFPVANNDSEEGRQENRRVEFTKITCM